MYDWSVFDKYHTESYPSLSAVISGHEAFLAIANVVFAYAGHVAFFTIFSELKDLRDFPKSLALLQFCKMVLYTVSAIVIYVFVGLGVASPALNSASSLVKKVAYGIAIPTIIDCDRLRRQCSCRCEVHLHPVMQGHVCDAY